MTEMTKERRNPEQNKNKGQAEIQIDTKVIENAMNNRTTTASWVEASELPLFNRIIGRKQRRSVQNKRNDE